MMGDSYQAIYDAVRSRITGGDIGRAVEEALSSIRNSNLSHYAEQAKECVRETCSEYQRPSVLYRPVLSRDGPMWCLLLGPNIQEGLFASGETVSKAMYAFDKAFYEEKCS